MGNYVLDDDRKNAMLAATGLIGRTGARQFEWGYLHDDVPFEEAGWYAKARWGGQIVMVENQPGPVEAAEALIRKVITGGRCVHCSRESTLDEEEGKCRYVRVGGEYHRGCEYEFPDDGPLPTTRKLAGALLQRGAPTEMVERALAGYYDDFKSPLAMPEMQLVADARAVGLEDIAQKVIDGEFDATKEESEAWARSPEGQETFAELLSGAKAHKDQPKRPKRTGRYTPPKDKR